jgi:hypothetical protein
VAFELMHALRSRRKGKVISNGDQVGHEQGV